MSGWGGGIGSLGKTAGEYDDDDSECLLIGWCFGGLFQADWRELAPPPNLVSLGCSLSSSSLREIEAVASDREMSDDWNLSCPWEILDIL